MGTAIEPAAACANCGAPVSFGRGLGESKCEFCGTVNQRAIEEAGKGRDQSNVESSQADTPIEQCRRAISDLETQGGRLTVRLLTMIFFVLVPGLGCAIAGPIAFGVNGYGALALFSGLLGGTMVLSGIIGIVSLGIKKSRNARDLSVQQTRLSEIQSA